MQRVEAPGSSWGPKRAGRCLDGCYENRYQTAEPKERRASSNKKEMDPDLSLASPRADPDVESGRKRPPTRCIQNIRSNLF